MIAKLLFYTAKKQFQFYYFRPDQFKNLLTGDMGDAIAVLRGDFFNYPTQYQACSFETVSKVSENLKAFG